MLRIFFVPDVLTRVLSALFLIAGAVGEDNHMNVILRGLFLVLASLLILNVFFRVRKWRELIRLSRYSRGDAQSFGRGAGHLLSLAQLRTSRNGLSSQRNGPQRGGG